LPVWKIFGSLFGTIKKVDVAVSDPGIKIFKPADGIDRPRCASCETSMWLLHIKPAELGFELRTYECARCAASQTFMVRMADDTAQQTESSDR